MPRDSFIREAFESICKKARESDVWYVCLMESIPFYGGPEEGGWWGEDRALIEYQVFASERLAKHAAEQIEKLAEKLSAERRRSYGEHMQRSVEWLEERGLEPSYLPEPDGPSEYYVMITQELPPPFDRGSRRYE